MSAIKEAYIMFNGQKVVARYDERTKTWAATTNAPANSSWSQPDHVYKVEIHAVDAANNKATMTSADPTYGDQLKIRVLEKSKPTATIVSPTQGSVLGASEQDIVSTTAPSLTVDTPTEGLITNSNRLTVTGSTTPGSDAVTIADVKVNNASVELSGDSTKTFSHEVTLTEGENTITVVSTDSIGKATTVTRHVTLDTKAPIITDVVAEATTVDSGGTIKITFKVTDAA